jgi:glucosyl-dolichyl phosphate glucuronosyltransferase
MRITVAICTRNRCHLLQQTLEQMKLVKIPLDVEWELLIVNNDCTDQTDNIILSFSACLPINRQFQPLAGLSNARNLAVSKASGEYILWTDDDVLVDVDWIEAYCDAFTRWPDAAVFGGPIHPWYAVTPPPWLTRVIHRVPGAYALQDLGNKELPLTTEKLPYGANYALKLKTQAAHLYDPQLGLQPGSTMGYEEIAVISAILESGNSGRWVPQAKVRHYLPEKRMSRTYLRRYFMGQGEYLMRTQPDSTSKKLYGKPRWLLRHAIEQELRYRYRSMFDEPEQWIDLLIASSMAWGRLRASSLPAFHRAYPGVAPR